jgi:hypothetical protein
MESDIVARLRDYHAKALAAPPYYRELMQHATDEIERLRVIVQGWEHSARNAERDIAQLRAERDEARKRLVSLIADLGQGGLPRYQNLIRNSHRTNMDFVNLVWSVIHTELETDER